MLYLLRLTAFEESHAEWNTTDTQHIFKYKNQTSHRLVWRWIRWGVFERTGQQAHVPVSKASQAKDLHSLWNLYARKHFFAQAQISNKCQSILSNFYNFFWWSLFGWVEPFTHHPLPRPFVSSRTPPPIRPLLISPKNALVESSVAIPLGKTKPARPLECSICRAVSANNA